MVEVRTKRTRGFALPTVLIASVVMLTVMAVSVASVTAISTALRTQYYEQLAKIAGEAGVAYAKACLAKNGNVPQWSDEKPLTPATDCSGNLLLGPRVQALVVAGGGGGAGAGAGGGAGGVVQQTTTVAVGTYPVVVGAGGMPGNAGLPVNGTNGGDSSFNGSVAVGGGFGARFNATNNGGDGGSGGGAGMSSSGPVRNGGSSTSLQGTLGGSGFIESGWLGTNAGGGGFSSMGGDAGQFSGAGNGGRGMTSDITGAITFYAGGGGGGEMSNGVPGLGAGGDPRYGAGSGVEEGEGTPAVDGTGSGGGGGSYRDSDSSYMDGGQGGSGVVVVRYANNGSVTATGGTVTTSGLYRIHRFTSNGTFQVTATGTSSCPTDPRCHVTVSGNIRSSFRVGMPRVDATGKAQVIPNTGYVELTRQSNGQVWRTYRQPAVQAAVVPDVCGGATASTLGWSNAVRITPSTALPDAPSAETISQSAGSVSSGGIYFRKDFAINQDGVYKVSAIPGAVSGITDSVQVSVDGSPVVTATGSYASGTVSLSPGCHSITAKLSSRSLFPRAANFTAALQTNTGTPIVTTDTSWRVTAGQLVHFSLPTYTQDSEVWVAAANVNSAASVSPSWTTVGGDASTRYISSSASGCPSSCPSQYVYLRDYKNIDVASNTDVKVIAVCDDSCTVYENGTAIYTTGAFNQASLQTITLTPGSHRFGIKLNNTAGGGAGAALVVRQSSNNAILTSTDTGWFTAHTWTASGSPEPQSYESNFVPPVN